MCSRPAPGGASPTGSAPTAPSRPDSPACASRWCSAGNRPSPGRCSPPSPSTARRRPSPGRPSKRRSPAPPAASPSRAAPGSTTSPGRSPVRRASSREAPSSPSTRRRSSGCRWPPTCWKSPGSRCGAAHRTPTDTSSRSSRDALPANKPAEGWRGAGVPGGAELQRAPTGVRSDRTPQPARDASCSEHALTPEAQARFLRSAWIANGLSYFLFGAFAALAPTLGERLGLGPRLAIWLVSAYLFTRSASFVLFWRWEGWEYSRGWLAAALVLPPAAFAALFFIPSPGRPSAPSPCSARCPASPTRPPCTPRSTGRGAKAKAADCTSGSSASGHFSAPSPGRPGCACWAASPAPGGLVTALGARVAALASALGTAAVSTTRPRIPADRGRPTLKVSARRQVATL